ncbi:MAG: DUF1846 family protein, partial [Lachnospiraceae bacterium]|nr:DUF1846 family protein [Lachnospiraceae bacterium]
IRRYYNTLCQAFQGNASPAEVMKIEMIMKQAGVTLDQRPVIAAANKKAAETGAPAAAMVLPDGRIVTGKTTPLLGASAALLLNVLKALGGIDQEVDLIAPSIIEPIQDLKVNHLGNSNPRLHTDEILIALTICAETDEKAEIAMQQLRRLKGCEAHTSVILSQVDSNTFRKLGVNLTSEPAYQNKKLFHG